MGVQMKMTFLNPKLPTSLLTCGLFFIPLLVLVACGTLQVSVQVQDTTTPTPTWMEEPGYMFADSIVLLGYGLPSLEMSAGSESLLHLYWKVTANPPHPYALGMGLRGSDGRLVWNYNKDTISWTPGRLVTEHRLRFPQQVSKGDYGLEVWLYDPDSGTRAFVTGSDRLEQDDVVRIVTLHLTRGTLSSPLGPTPLPLPALVPVATSVFTTTARP
jgi:hypothetical protein